MTVLARVMFVQTVLVASPMASAALARPAGKTYTIVIDKMKFGAVSAGLGVGDTII